jgi:UDP-GlcNAc:undecaprenyl-phosphate/decaprenyl-phosphate GlcNAc-1-phosphate transferase
MILNPLSIVLILIFSSLSIILLQKLFIKKKIVDHVNERSSHTSIATRSGGVSIFLPVFLFSCFFYLNGVEIYDFSIIVPLSLLLIVGMYDDIYNVSFQLKFLFQIIAAKILIDNGLLIDNLHGVLGLYEINRIIAQLITIFFIVAIINAINFIDGIDGLAVSIVILFISMFELFSFTATPFLNLSALIIISSLPLLYYNFKKNKKVFLGDSGSLVLGGVVSAYVIFILSQKYQIKPEYDLHKILFVLSILFLPIIDIIRIFFLRIFTGKSPFKADKKHIHHILLSKTNSHLFTTLILLTSSIIIIFLFQILF